MIVNLNDAFYSYDNLVTDARKLAKQYESILQYVTIGVSHDNRDIVMLKLGCGHQYLLCCGGVHGRESINSIVLLKIVEYYADLFINHRQEKFDLKKKMRNYSHNFVEEYEQMLYGRCIYELLQTFTILFVPLLNPDGYMVSLKGFQEIRDQELRKVSMSMGIPHKEWKFNARGVDINRNFPSRHWRGKNSADYASSELETCTLINVFLEYKPKGFLDFHSRGKQIYYYRSVMPDSYNLKQLEIANRLKAITNYELIEPENEIDSGDSGGNTVHYFSENFYKPALTIETIDEPAQFPLDYKYRQSTFEEMKSVVFEFGRMVV